MDRCHGAALAILLMASPGAAAAQSASYVIGGLVAEFPAREEVTPASSSGITIRGLSLGVGFPLGKASLEFLGVWHSAETDVDRDTTSAAVTDTRVRNRDVPFVAAIRFGPRCPNTFCAEVIGGFGINFSRRSLLRVADCGTPQLPIAPCQAVSMPLVPVNKEEPTFFVGTDIRLLVLGRFDIGSTLRIWYVNRYRDKTMSHAANVEARRTPHNERIEVGVNATWHLREP